MVQSSLPTGIPNESAPRALTPARMFWEEIRDAQAMTDEDRILAGPRLFDVATRICKDGIRAQFPNADDAEVSRIFRKRLALQEQIERAEVDEYLRELRDGE